MTYKIKQDVIRREAYVMLLSPKARKKVTTMKVITELGKVGIGYPRKLYTEGAFVLYKGKTGKLIKVADKGVHLQFYEKPNGVLIPEKRKFITHEEYIKTARVQPMMVYPPLVA